MSVRLVSSQSPMIFYVIPTERSDEGSRDLSHTFKMTLVVVRDDINFVILTESFFMSS